MDHGVPEEDKLTFDFMRFWKLMTTPQPKSASLYLTLTSRPACRKGRLYVGCVMTARKSSAIWSSCWR